MASLIAGENLWEGDGVSPGEDGTLRKDVVRPAWIVKRTVAEGEAIGVDDLIVIAYPID